MDEQTTHGIVAKHAYQRMLITDQMAGTDERRTKDAHTGSANTTIVIGAVEATPAFAAASDALMQAFIDTRATVILGSLYPTQAEERLPLTRTILSDAIVALQRGRASLSEGHRLGCAAALLEASANLDLAITYDEIDEAAALILSSCSNALRNASFVDLSQEQLDALIRVVSQWFNVEPFLTFERASVLVDELESLEMRVAPPFFPALVELLTAEDESVS